MLVPKAEELVANPYRHGGKDGAKDSSRTDFGESSRAHARSRVADFPITVYYAFKQSESDDDGEASTGWETLLDGMIRSGWEITSTWPMRSETSDRLIAQRHQRARLLDRACRCGRGPTTRQRPTVGASSRRSRPSCPTRFASFSRAQIAPVDLPQAAIGPGMAVFSRYARCSSQTASKMTVRSALARINEILDQVLNEQEGDFDSTSRFAIAWYRQHGYGVGKFGDADNLARARNTSVDTMDRDEILTSRAGKVQLIKPADLSWDYDVLEDSTRATGRRCTT